MENTLKKLPGINFSGISSMPIDGLYIEGYVTDEDYKSYYMDRTRTFIPTYRNTPEFSGEELKAKGDRMATVQRKNTMLHNINMATKILDL